MKCSTLELNYFAQGHHNRICTRHILDCKIGIEPITFSWKENVLPLDYLQSKSLLNVPLCNSTYFAFYLFTALPTAMLHTTYHFHRSY